VIEIPLTRGLVAVVDDDAAHLGALKWHARTGKGLSYAARNVVEGGRRKTLLLHRLLIQAKPGEIVDHINGDTLDNRMSNLRIVTASENQRNRSGSRRDNLTSPYLGVSFNKPYGKFSSIIFENGRNRCLGYFDTAEEANVARLRAEKELYGIQPRRAAAFEGMSL